MKILIAVHHFPPKYKGGAEWRAYRTAAAMQARGHDVRVVSVEHVDGDPCSGLTWHEEVYDGIQVRRLSFCLDAAPDLFVWQYNNPWIGQHMDELFQQDRPDVFHLIGGYLMSGSVLESARRLAIPTVVSLTDYWFLCPRISMLRSDNTISTLPIDPEVCVRCLLEEKRRFRLPGRIFPQLMNQYYHHQDGMKQKVQARLDYLKGVLNGVDAIISPSQFLREMYVQSGIDPVRIGYARQGRDFPDLKPEMLEKSPSAVMRIGYVGQIASHKGVHLLIEALKHLPDLPVSLTVYGDLEHDAAYTHHLRELCGNDERIQLAGAYMRKDVSRVMRDLDVIAVPSIWYENSPNAILEAFAHRTPVIATNLGGMSELVQDQVNGLLFAPGDARDLAAQLKKLVEEPGLLAALRGGIGPVKSVAQEIDELAVIYQDVVCAH